MADYEVDEQGRRLIQRYDQTPFNCSVQELVDYLVQKGLDLEKVWFRGHVSLKFFTPETEEERKRMEESKAAQQKRQESWERETYERLKAKYQ